MQFQEVAKLALAHRSRTKKYRNPKSLKRWEQVIRLHMNPYIATMDIKDVNNDVVVDILSKVWTDHTPTGQTARMVLEYIIGYAIHKGYRPESNFNPARWKDGVSFDLLAPADIHTVVPHEAITVGEAQRIMPTLVTGTPRQKALAFGILTAGRASEFCKANWSEIDMENHLFMVPPSRCKVKRADPFVVPLSHQAVDLLKSIPKQDGVDSVFASKRGVAPCSHSIQINLQKALPDHPNVTTHGCRATFSTWCAETGQEPAIREACLMHVDENRTSRAYNRSDLLDQRRLLMQQWADAVYHA